MVSVSSIFRDASLFSDLSSSRSSKVEFALSITALVIGWLAVVASILLSVLLGSPILGLGVIFFGGIMISLGAYVLFKYFKDKEIKLAVRYQQDLIQKLFEVSRVEIEQEIEETNKKCREIEQSIKKQNQQIESLKQDRELRKDSNRLIVSGNAS